MANQISLNGRVLRHPISHQEFSDVFTELVRLWRASQVSHDAQLVGKLNSEAITRLYAMEKAIDDELVWLQGLAFEMGFSLETKEQLRPR